MNKMLCKKVNDRYSADQAVRDEWVQQLAPNALNVEDVNVVNKEVLGKMRAFHNYNKLKKVALQVIAQQLSDESLKLLRQTFVDLDGSGRGALTLQQMEAAISHVQCDADTRIELLQTTHEMAGNTGEINYTQFLAVNIDKQHYLREEACKAAFVLFDVDGDGYISRNDMQLLFANTDEMQDGNGGVASGDDASQKGSGSPVGHKQSIRKSFSIGSSSGANPLRGVAGADQAHSGRSRQSLQAGRQSLQGASKPHNGSGSGESPKARESVIKETMGDQCINLLGVHRDEIEQIIEEHDEDGDGKINFKEFLKMMAKTALLSGLPGDGGKTEEASSREGRRSSSRLGGVWNRRLSGGSAAPCVSKTDTAGSSVASEANDGLAPLPALGKKAPNYTGTLGSMGLPSLPLLPTVTPPTSGGAHDALLNADGAKTPHVEAQIQRTSTQVLMTKLQIDKGSRLGEFQSAEDVARLHQIAPEKPAGAPGHGSPTRRASCLARRQFMSPGPLNALQQKSAAHPSFGSTHVSGSTTPPSPKSPRLELPKGLAALPSVPTVPVAPATSSSTASGSTFPPTRPPAPSALPLGAVGAGRESPVSRFVAGNISPAHGVSTNRARLSANEGVGQTSGGAKLRTAATVAVASSAFGKLSKSPTVIFGARGRTSSTDVPAKNQPLPWLSPPRPASTEPHSARGRASPNGKSVALDVIEIGVEDTQEPSGPNPLWDILREKHIDMAKLKDALEGRGKRFVNSMLCKTDAVPPALFMAVTLRSPELVKALITFRADVRRKSVGKAWKVVKPGQTPLEVNEVQKGRFVGTVVYERCEAIETLMKAEEDRLRGWRSGRRASSAARRYFDNADADMDGITQLCITACEDDLSKVPASNLTQEEEETDDILAKKTLYGAESVFVCQHISGSPSSQFELGDLTGEGTFGVVSRITDKATKLQRAMKSVPKSLLEESDLWQEIELMRNIDHPFITRLFGTYEDSNNIYMIMQHCAGGELYDAIEEVGCFSETTACGIFQQMLVSVSYLHFKQICHRDLKPENFLFLTSGRVEKACVKLIDFGTARRFGPNLKMTTKICTIQYVAPEILARNTECYTEKCDTWSLGVCLYLMLCGTPPFCADTETQVLKKVRKGRYKFEPEEVWRCISDDAKHLVKSLLMIDANDRLSAQEALRLPFFCRVPKLKTSSAVLKTVILRLATFRNYFWFKQKSLELVANQLAEDEIGDILSVWLELDRANTGRLYPDDIARAIPADLSDPGFSTKRLHLLSSMREDSKKGDINYTMFVAAMLDKGLLSDVACHSAFNLLDLDGDGVLRINELSLILQTLHKDEGNEHEWYLDKIVKRQKLSECDPHLLEECRQVLNKYDQDHDGSLDFDEFMSMLVDA